MVALSRSVEDLLDQVAALTPAKAGESCSLHIADAVTFRNAALPQDVAMAIVLDALLAKGYFPDGFTQISGGRTYRYRFNGG